MIMVGHEAIGVTDPVVAFVYVLKSVQEVLPVRVILENRFFLVPAGGHMVDCAGVFDAERTSHGVNIADNPENGNKVDLTLRGSRYNERLFLPHFLHHSIHTETSMRKSLRG